MARGDRSARRGAVPRWIALALGAPAPEASARPPRLEDVATPDDVRALNRVLSPFPPHVVRLLAIEGALIAVEEVAVFEPALVGWRRALASLRAQTPPVAYPDVPLRQSTVPLVRALAHAESAAVGARETYDAADHAASEHCAGTLVEAARALEDVVLHRTGEMHFEPAARDLLARACTPV